MDPMREMEVAGETEGARRATGVSPEDAPARVLDPAVEAKPTRRRFSAEYKLRRGLGRLACKRYPGLFSPLGGSISV